jgi:DNA-binding LacI/PurR family transcriptional regulator
LKVRVPEQLAVLGFDDLDMAEYAEMTTIRQHLDKSGRLAVEILLEQPGLPLQPPRHVNIPLTIVEREPA